jgi:3-oxoacyl-[acyl-carrier protein] reductase
LVTGKSQGIGAAISKATIEAGCDIYMHYFHSSDYPFRMKEFAVSRNQRAIYLQVVLNNEQDLIGIIHECGDFLGQNEIVVLELLKRQQTRVHGLESTIFNLLK